MESKFPIEIRRSAIQGYGVFAACDIQKDQLIEECPVIYFNHRCPELYNYSFNCKTVSGRKQDLIALGYGSLYNHAEEPNAEWVFDVDQQILIFKAKKNIKKGEEIFIYYAEYWFAVRNIPRRDLPNVIASNRRKRFISLLWKVAGFIFLVWVIKNAVISGCSIYFARG